jgi:hypothetical protein
MKASVGSLFFWRDKFAIKAYLCSTRYCCVLDIDVYLNDTHRTRCCVFITAVITRTRHTCVTRVLPILLQNGTLTFAPYPTEIF